MSTRGGRFLGGVSIAAGAPFSAVFVDQAITHGLAQFMLGTRTLLVLVDVHGRPAAFNAAFERLREWAPGSRTLDDLALPADKQRLNQMIAAARDSDTAIRGQLEFGPADNSTRYDCYITSAGKDASLIVAEPSQLHSDLFAVNAELAEQLNQARVALERKSSELQAVLAQADEMAHTDSLTLLPNRRSILADLQRQLTYAERYKTPLAVSMLDLDGFKHINDHYGHAAGDKVLITLTRGLRDRIRQPDQIGRYGGDELLVILPNSTGIAASEQASRLCQYVRSTLLPLADAPPTRVTLSVGITQLKPGEDWHAIVERADRALYEAKHQGGDRWLVLEA